MRVRKISNLVWILINYGMILCSALRVLQVMFEYKHEKMRKRQSRSFLNLSGLLWHITYNLTEFAQHFLRGRICPIRSFFQTKLYSFIRPTVGTKAPITDITFTFHIFIYQFAFGIPSDSLGGFLSKTPWSLALDGFIWFKWSRLKYPINIENRSW